MVMQDLIIKFDVKKNESERKKYLFWINFNMVYCIIIVISRYINGC